MCVFLPRCNVWSMETELQGGECNNALTVRKSPLLQLGLSVIKRKREEEQASARCHRAFVLAGCFHWQWKVREGCDREPNTLYENAEKSALKRNRNQRWNILKFRNAVGGLPLINGQCLRKRGGRGWFPALALSRSHFSRILWLLVSLRKCLH